MIPEWLAVETTSLDPLVETVAIRLLFAWLCGWIVAMLARRHQPANSRDTLTVTLVLMSILIAMATQIIGDNIARAFSLVGALSIVRFRTAVPATRDVAFVLAAVVVGMAVGAGQYWVTALGLVTVALATQFNKSSENTGSGTAGGTGKTTTAKSLRLSIVVGLSATEGWEQELKQSVESYELLTAETTRRGGAMELVYRLVPNEDTDAIKLIASLNALSTVESVSVKQVK
ncbi:DUF4956 domain-containing protein [Novipirellula artificiosorum]|uniref:Uncharacterized protein n=1 Tax=Novipirellula artificiosorum TaxID=2528016 RepID=A0A5C6CW17_9BACT|nr:DUF4956 domain-containing protein [Novipirellula artificiosorum]TWU28740.1 hypothetical protein Poly41_69020 [Novipirellula artificiosorum]